MRDVESMRAIARAHQGRNLADFEKALRDYRDGKAFPLFYPLLLLFFLLLSNRPMSNHLFFQSFPPTQQSARI